MYKLQVCNAQTQEIVREKTYKKTDLIFSLLESAEMGHECFLFGEDLRTYKGKYVTHSSFTDGQFIIYKIDFDLTLSEIQARIASYV